MSAPHTALRIEDRPLDDPDAVTMIAAAQQYYLELYGGHDRDPTDDTEFAPPNGVFLVGYLDDLPVACGGWRRRDGTTAEIKRMFVLAGHRGRGHAAAILDALERSAQAAGARTIVLNTGHVQRDAIGLYLAHGYEHSDERYGHYRDIDGALFFRKALP